MSRVPSVVVGTGRRRTIGVGLLIIVSRHIKLTLNKPWTAVLRRSHLVRQPDDSLSFTNTQWVHL